LSKAAKEIQQLLNQLSATNRYLNGTNSDRHQIRFAA
jgi:hypothetical protein